MCESGHVFFDRVALILDRLAEEEDEILRLRREKDERYRQNRVRQIQEDEDRRQRNIAEMKDMGNLPSPTSWASRNAGGWGGQNRNRNNQNVAQNIKEMMGFGGRAGIYPTFP